MSRKPRGDVSREDRVTAKPRTHQGLTSLFECTNPALYEELQAEGTLEFPHGRALRGAGLEVGGFRDVPGRSVCSIVVTVT